MAPACGAGWTSSPPPPRPGTCSWQNWTVTGCQLAGGTALFLWNPTTGALYLWTALSHAVGTATLGHASYAIKASGWNTGAGISLQASDINSDGNPDLWTVAAGGIATGYLVTSLSGSTGTLNALGGQALYTGKHAWKLDDANSGAIGTAADTVGAAPLTGSGNAMWRSGDLFDREALLNSDGTGVVRDPAGTGHLNSGAGTQPIDTTTTFTAALWAKPNALGGTVLSEDGAHSSRFVLSADATTGKWVFGLATSDTTTPSYDQVASLDPVQLGVWTRLQVVYNTATAELSLYVNGALAGTKLRTTTPTWPTNGALHVGDAQVNNAHTGYFSGVVAQLQSWKLAITPGQIALRAHANGLYVSADSAGAQPLIANRTVAGTWETFDLIDLGGGKVALRAHANGTYVTAENAGTQPLISRATTIGAWETFTLVHNADGSISLLACDSQYVTAENAGTQPLISRATTIGTWESFDIIGG